MISDLLRRILLQQSLKGLIYFSISGCLSPVTEDEDTGPSAKSVVLESPVNEDVDTGPNAKCVVLESPVNEDINTRPNAKSVVKVGPKLFFYQRY